MYSFRPLVSHEHRRINAELSSETTAEDVAEGSRAEKPLAREGVDDAGIHRRQPHRDGAATIREGKSPPYLTGQHNLRFRPPLFTFSLESLDREFLLKCSKGKMKTVRMMKTLNP
ncbi:hypothetical protein LR48_Vigan569s001800 [Vigna angularis]|uniref:Uncharacterized protein n=1 Tax=Phaseolus angularis TaxID=3914 RepID=A0A0L9TE03_PHAAN|nr:hypothetical protein LR48_Vigan569s001800 [Vigna angularis]